MAVNLVKNSWRFCIVLANRTLQGHFWLWGCIRLFFAVILDFWRKPIRRGSRVKMQIFKAELKSWMPGEFAPLKSKHDGGVAEANQQNLLNVIANAVKQSLKSTQNVIANKVKQLFLHCHCEPKARQSFQLHSNGLPRRCAPRNDLGRSMIEMLGVLAIIAVLSVGGIAGYSKAMQKYKLNRWKENIITLTANLKIMYVNERSYTDKDNVLMMSLFKDMGIIPQDMLDSQNKDMFGNSWQIYSYTLFNKSRLFLRFWTVPDNNAVEVCKEMFYLQSEYEDSWAVVLNEGVAGKTGGILTVCGKSAPDNYAKLMKCVPFDLANIASKCGVCQRQRCDLIMVLANGR